jgi:hypothetical protein
MRFSNRSQAVPDRPRIGRLGQGKA